MRRLADSIVPCWKTLNVETRNKKQNKNGELAAALTKRKGDAVFQILYSMLKIMKKIRLDAPRRPLLPSL